MVVTGAHPADSHRVALGIREHAPHGGGNTTCQPRAVGVRTRRIEEHASHRSHCADVPERHIGLGDRRAVEHGSIVVTALTSQLDTSGVAALAL